MRLFIIGTWCLLSFASKAQQRDSALQAYCNTLSAHHLYDGNIAMAEMGKKVFAYAGGYANYATQQPNTSQSRFNLASISKIFTSTAILQLKEQRKLKLEDEVIKYLPTFPFKGITIRHLLTHTSGLPNLELYEEVVKQYPDTVISNAAVLPLLQQWKHGLYFPPGDQFRYCNTNYTLLALIVEKITGTSFPLYLRQHIFLPAGMKDTYVAVYGSKTDTLCVKQQVKPTYYDSLYCPSEQVKRYRFSEYNNQASIGPSNVITTVDDMIRFDNAFFSGKLLSLKTVEEALTPLKLNNGKEYTEQMDTMEGEGSGQYGLGWEIFHQPNFGRGVGHGGFKFGLATFYYHNMDRNQMIVAYTNGNNQFGKNVTSCFQMLNHLPAQQLDLRKSAVRAYAKALIEKGPDHAACMLHLYMADTTHFYFNNREMNFLGYDFLYQCSAPGHQQWSLETFKLNTFLDPHNFNTYDSYGEALLECGYKADAIQMYKRSLELNPTSEDGIKAMKKLGLM
ncbi:MAG: beta-lactamase family protein [Chitinophaga sp.]|uniref:serine hydrolase domain-containing protein n=1 Tax=Chitinophaga sp. TaxID=1869181 RepID=UPI0025BDEED3|nr:serine hydrolase domain-containing protein [Chitinophaga sp.]MBV8251365.1 beta-lactamase family protein [Chitinophaga sp.]